MAVNKPEVHSWHLNIDEGDSTVHFLLNRDTVVPLIQSAVLIDGGRKYGKGVLQEFIEFTRGPKCEYRVQGSGGAPEFFKGFNSIVVTHWDADHIDGIYELMEDDLHDQAQKIYDTRKPTKREDFVKLVQESVRCTFCKYVQNTTTKEWNPTTVMYVPYWTAAGSNTSKQPNFRGNGKIKVAGSHKANWALDKDGYLLASAFAWATVGKKGEWWSAYVKVAILRQSKDIVGFDFFTNNKLTDAEKAISPLQVSQALASKKYPYPIMFCVAADMHFCDEAGLSARKDMEWRCNDDLTNFRLVKKGVADFEEGSTWEEVLGSEIKSGEGKAGTRNIGTTAIVGKTTGNNQASIAAMIIWPNTKEAVVSHYFAGDLGEEVEQQILRWSCVPTTATGEKRIPIHVQNIKLSHHGGKFSTPIQLLCTWLPEIIVASNGLSKTFNHVSWEILTLLHAYVHWRPIGFPGPDTILPRLFCTNYPIYLCRYWVNEEGTGPKVTYVTPGSTTSLEDKSPSAEWKTAVNKMWESFSLHYDEDSKNLLELPIPKNKNERGDFVCEHLWNEWEMVSSVPSKSYYLPSTIDSGIMRSEDQTVRVITVRQKLSPSGGLLTEVQAHQGARFANVSVTDFWESLAEDVDDDTIINIMEQRLKSGVVFDVPVNKKTKADLASPNLRSRPVGDLISEKAGKSLLLDDDLYDQDPESNSTSAIIPYPSDGHAHKPPSSTVCLPSTAPSPHAPEPLANLNIRLDICFLPPLIPMDDGLTYFISSSTKKVTQDPIFTTKAALPASNLDLMIGRLNTGALVFPVKLTQDSQTLELHGSDELRQWLAASVGANDQGGFSFQATASLTNVSMFKLSARLGKKEVPWMNTFTFSSDKNIEAFQGLHASAGATAAPRWLLPYEAQEVHAYSRDVVGPAQMILMGLDPSTAITQASFNASQIFDFFEIKQSASIKRFASLVGFNIDVAAGSKNMLWYFPDNRYTTILRLCFKPANTGTNNALSGTLKDVLTGISDVTGITINISEPRMIVKKTWLRRLGNGGPYGHEIVPELAVKALVGVKGPKSKFELKVETALVLEQKKTTWVLTLDPTGGGKTITELIEFVASLLPTKIDIPSLESYLPGLNNVVLRRITYVTKELKKYPYKAVSLEFQITWATMILRSAIKIVLKPTVEVSFYGGLFPENRVDKLGPSFSFIPFMPNYESWTAFTITPMKSANSPGEDNASEVGNLGAVYGALTQAGGQKEDLPQGPTQFELVGLGFSVAKPRITFNAIVMSPAPPKNTPVPVLRLGAAKLNLDFDFVKKRIEEFSIATTFVLTAPNTGLSANIALAVMYKDSAWTLKGEVAGITGGLLYSLFDDDCNLEMVNLLQNIRLDLALEYMYDKSGKGKKLKASGELYLGKLTLTYDYIHNGNVQKPGNGEPETPRWTFNANLFVDSPSTKLKDVVASIAGDDLAEDLPSFIGDIDILPDKNTALTSLRVERLPEYLVVILRIQLNDGTSIAFYQIQKQRENPSIMTVTPTKRVLMFTMGGLPEVKGIPLVGTLKPPFDQLSFSWVSGGTDSQGLTRGEIKAIEGCLKEGELGLMYKDNVKPVKEPTTPNPADLLLSSGFHLVVVNDKKTLLDYAFGGKKKDGGKEKPSYLEPITDLTTQAATSSGEGASTAPVNKVLGPVKISGLGLKFNMSTRTLAIIVDGSVKLGPLDLSLIGFSVSFTFGKNFTLKNFGDITTDFALNGLSASFNQAPITLAGLFEHGKKDGLDYYQGGASIGFVPYLFTAAGYYGESRDKSAVPVQYMLDSEVYKSFFTYCRLDGPLFTVGFAEFSGLTGGFGYNSTLRYPTAAQVPDFPFVAVPDSSGPADALTKLLKSGWFAPKKDSYWVAAGFSVLAFEMLQVNVVAAAQFTPNVKLGIFGLATAEMPKKAERKFVRVQLGIAATIDFAAGILTIDGQLTPASFVLDPSCHLYGGFALYSWFASRDEMQGNWVFTIGGYHSSFKLPQQYPNPPRLGISWRFDDSINITGEAYFAITPKMCMGGGKLSVTLSLGPLYAYFNAWADFLINYKPFFFMASGGINVGVHFTLDLWLVTIHIEIDLGATLYLEGPPIAGRVHVNFWVFGFDVNFGHRDPGGTAKLDLEAFYKQVLQADAKPPAATSKAITMVGEGICEPVDPASHIFSCTSGLLAEDVENPQTSPNKDPWTVRGAIFAFRVSCKFAVKEATVRTVSPNDDADIPTHKVENPAKVDVFARPMGLKSAMKESTLQISITPVLPPFVEMEDDIVPLNPEWNNNVAVVTSVPCALWGEYKEDLDPTVTRNNSSLLDGSKDNTIDLMTGVQLYAPKARRSPDDIAQFNVEEAMRQIAGYGAFPAKEDSSVKWKPLERNPDKMKQFEDVRKTWEDPEIGKGAAMQAVEAWAELDVFGWDLTEPGAVDGKVPTTLLGRIRELYIEAPAMSSAA